MANITHELRKIDVVNQLNKARDDYYNGTPTMTDAEYDTLEDWLRKEDPNNSFFKTIGAPVSSSSAWSKAAHAIPMTSLNKAQGESDMETWGKNHAVDDYYIVMEKLDGISISLRYDKGELVQAVTRGDGDWGEDITRNVKMMKGLPKSGQSDFSGFVRGEIVCLRSDFDAHFQGESNPRNTASGTAKRQSNADLCRHLTVMPFQLISDGKVQYATKEDEFLALGEIGFTNIPNCHITPKVGRKKFSALATVFSIYKKYVDTVRDSLDYEIDGLVVCLNDNAKWAAAGERNHRPAGSIAFKFPHDSAKTVLRNIVWQVGNTGRVTPVAEFDSVSLAGANVRRASLHNVSNIKRIAAEYGDCYGLGAGDTIMVSRRNDVIPYVESLVSTMNPSHNFEGIHPNECPECQTSLVFEGEYLVCPNTLSCPAQVSGGIKRWIKKVGILDWGDAIIEALCEDGMVNDPADLYKLTYDQLSALELSGRVVGTAAERMLTNLHDKKELPLNVFVGSLGIPLVARSMCKIIVDAGYDTIDKMAAATENEISSIHGVGGTKAQSFVEGFRFRSGLISKLMMQGITIKQPSNGALTGMTVCMTGFRDAVMQEAIESAGGTIKSGVVKNLTYLVSKDPNSTSGKAKKARAQGTTVIGQDDMWEILGV